MEEDVPRVGRECDVELGSGFRGGLDLGRSIETAAALPFPMVAQKQSQNLHCILCAVKYCAAQVIPYLQRTVRTIILGKGLGCLMVKY